MERISRAHELSQGSIVNHLGENEERSREEGAGKRRTRGTEEGDGEEGVMERAGDESTCQ